MSGGMVIKERVEIGGAREGHGILLS